MKRNSLLRRIPAHRKDPSTWPKVKPEALPAERRDAFVRNRNAVYCYLRGASWEEIKADTGLGATFTRTLLMRCIAPDGTGEIHGERAMVPYARVGNYRRKAVIQRTVDSGRGHCSGALTLLLAAFPEIEERLKEEILKQVPEGKKLAETRISFRNLQRSFLSMCEAAGMKARGEWPFNTRTHGAGALRNYVRHLSHLSPAAFAAARFGAEARTRMHVGTGQSALLRAELPGDMVGIDEWVYDGIGTIEVNVPGGGTQDIAVERVGFVIMVDLEGKAIWSIHPYYTGVINAADFRTVMQKGITPASTPVFTIPGMSFGVVDAGFPASLIASMKFFAPVGIMLDNLATHLQLDLIGDIGRRFGSWINFGPVAAWYRRAVLERTIGELLRACAHRLPSTTGSSPVDTRRDEPVETAVRLKIRWEHLCEIALVAAAQYNATPNEGIGHLSPIALLRQHEQDPSRGFFPIPMPLAYQHAKSIKATREIATVRGSQKQGDRPHINLDRVEYTNVELAGSWDLIGTKLLIDVDDDDMRTLDAAIMGSGYSLGTLTAKGPWSRTQHTRATRKAINRLKERRVLAIPAEADPVYIYLEYLRGSSVQQAGTPAKPKVSKSARRLAEGMDKTGEKPQPPDNVVQGPVSLAPPPPKPEDAVEMLARQPKGMRALLRAARGRRT